MLILVEKKVKPAIANVANAPGEDYVSDVPKGYSSWIDYWEKKRYLQKKAHARRCRNCGEETTELVGGHVEYCEKHDNGKWYYDKSKGIYITPLCDKCNKPENTVRFYVATKDLIKIPRRKQD
jgi:hypothetical protein